jgi:hypothetical protein
MVSGGSVACFSTLHARYTRTGSLGPKSGLVACRTEGGDALDELLTCLSDHFHAGGVQVSPEVGTDEESARRTRKSGDIPESFLEAMLCPDRTLKGLRISLEPDAKGMARKTGFLNGCFGVFPGVHPEFEVVHLRREMIDEDLMGLAPLS